MEEYRRLVNEIPIVECQALEEHNHQVLHVSFSHNGEMFATTSKDGYVVVRILIVIFSYHNLILEF